jgi:hypothetical protein
LYQEPGGKFATGVVVLIRKAAINVKIIEGVLFSPAADFGAGLASNFRQ